MESIALEFASFVKVERDLVRERLDFGVRVWGKKFSRKEKMPRNVFFFSFHQKNALRLLFLSIVILILIFFFFVFGLFSCSD